MNMRKLTTFVLLLLAVVLHAQQITPDEAAAIASEFLNSSSTPLKGTMRVKAKRVMPKTASTDQESQPFYVFNGDKDQGFVIISGDKRAKKIIGYSDKGNFEFSNMPPQLAAMLDQYAEQISKISGTTTDPSWSASARSASDGESVLLETANWGQGYPYNLQTPIIDGDHCPTGCVATALAIVMKYHNWPEEYDWDSMPLQTDKPVEQISRLMKDAGEAVYMEYSPWESGAHINWTGHRLRTVFHYSPECEFVVSEHFSTQDWFSKLKSEIDKGKPVIYNGSGSGGNHAFIIDGYNDDTYHVNWGWDGQCNGYFSLDALTPGDNQDFSNYTGMVYNIEPDRSGKEYSEAFTDYGYLWTIKKDLGESMNLSVENVKKGECFHVINTLYTLPPGFVGLVGIALVDKDDQIKEVLQTNPRSTWSDVENSYKEVGTGDYYFNLVVNSDIDPSDRLQLVTKRNDETNYKLVLGTSEWPSYVGVANNTPRYGSVKYIIGDGVSAYYLPVGEGTFVDLPTGTTVQSVLRGAGAAYKFTSDDENFDGNIHVQVRGPQIYGDQSYSQKSVEGSVTVVGDYEIEAHRMAFTSETVTLDMPGTLQSYISAKSAPSVRELSISGTMNAIDFWYIRDNFSSLKVLDLHSVVIDEVEATDSRFFETEPIQKKNAIPEWALTALANLEKLILPESITAIESNSLQNMAIRGITIPKGVQYIGLNVLYGNQHLETITMLNPTPVPISDCVFTETKCPASGYLFVPEGAVESYKNAPVWQDFLSIEEGEAPVILSHKVTIDGIIYDCSWNKATVAGFDGEIADVIIPPTIEVDGTALKVTAIDDLVFMGCSTLQTLEMSDNILDIGSLAFASSSVKKVVLSKNLKSIGYAAFNNCYSLEECDLTDNITSLGSMSFYCNGVKKIRIPKLAKPENSYFVFGMNINLKEFDVDESNEVYKAIDGVLYRNSYDGLKLESVPAKKEGKLFVADDCDIIMGESFCGITGITHVIFNPALSVIEQDALRSANSVQHISLPPSAFIYPQAIYACNNLESIAFTGMPQNSSGIIVDCPQLKNIMMANDEDKINLDDAFKNISDDINIYSLSLTPNFEYSKAATIYVPGATTGNYSSTYSNVKEMWTYQIDKENGAIRILPLYEGIVIDKVTINDEEIQPVNNLFRFGQTNSDVYSRSAQNIDVLVDYTLHGHQSMTTHYDADFNSAIPSTVLPILAESITLKPTEWSGYEGESFTISATVLPENTTDPTLSWTSSDQTVATVDNEGKVSVLKPGNCVITASTTDGSDLSADCIITSSSSINAIFADDSGLWDVYNLAGALILRDGNTEQIRLLTPGIYIFRQASKSLKIFIK